MECARGSVTEGEEVEEVEEMDQAEEQ